MTTLNLTIALERYDRHMPFFMGTVKPPEGIALKPLDVGMAPPRRDGIDRHRRMLDGLEFDICEFGLSPFVIAKSRNRDLPIVAVPVFPRRLFSQNHIFVNADAGIETPLDLIGKRVAVRTFQTTLSVLARGDLKFDYGVPWEKIRWFVQHPEAVPLRAADGVSVEPIPDGRDDGEMLVNGELDAMFHPHPPPSVLSAGGRIRRLFSDPKAEAVRYFGKHGYYPIMHLMVLRRELVEREPWLLRAVMDMCEDAKRQADDYYADPGFSQLAFARNAYEDQRDTLGPDPWPNGFAANRANLERFIEYARDQNLIDGPLSAESLFPEAVLDT